MNIKIHDELPEIHVVHHARAKRLKLSVSPQGIRLTVPPLAQPRQIVDFIHTQQQWLLDTWQKARQSIANLPANQTLPDILNFEILHKSFTVQYIEHERLLYRCQNQSVEIHQPQAGYALTQFVVDMAKKYLIPYAYQLARQQQLTPSQIRIATPSTRWGSCNRQGKIMLHAGLLLMPKTWADNVIWHELTHLTHLHHQAEFYQLLAQYYPPSVQLKSAVKRFHLPWWWQTRNHTI